MPDVKKGRSGGQAAPIRDTMPSSPPASPDFGIFTRVGASCPDLTANTGARCPAPRSMRFFQEFRLSVFSGLKGRKMIAQGEALGWMHEITSEALKGRDKVVSPLQGLVKSLLHTPWPLAWAITSRPLRASPNPDSQRRLLNEPQ